MSEATKHTVSDEALKIMVAQYGVRGTARVLGMDERQTAAFRRRVSRAKWVQDPALAAAMKKNNVGMSPANVAKPIVATVSPQQAIAQEISALGSKSRLGLARGIAKAAEHVETMNGSAILDDAQKIKATAQTADLVHGWKDQAPQVKIRLDLLGTASSEAFIDVESEAIPHDNWQY